MEIEHWQVWPDISKSNKEQYHRGERESKVMYDMGTPSRPLRNKISKVPQGPVEGDNNQVSTSPPPTFGHTETVMLTFNWQHYVVTAISNTQRRLDSVDNRLKAIDGRVAVLEDTVIERTARPAASTAPCIAVCPLPSPRSSPDDLNDKKPKLEENAYPEQTSQTRRRRQCAQPDASESSENNCASSKNEWHSPPASSHLPADVNHVTLTQTILSRAATEDLNAAQASGTTIRIEAITSGIYMFTCETCGRYFAEKGSIVRHLNRVHKNLRKLPCEFCGHVFAKRLSLKNHVKTVHTNPLQFTCDICEYSFTKRSSLNMHVKSVHKKIRDFTCEFCGRAFSRKKSMVRHIAGVHKK